MTEQTPEIKNQFSDLSRDELVKVANDFKEIAGKQNIDLSKTFGIVEAGITADVPTVDKNTMDILKKFAESITQVGKPQEQIESKNSDPLREKYDVLINSQIKNATSEVQKIDRDFPVEVITSMNCAPELKLTLIEDVAIPLASRQLKAIEDFKAAFGEKKEEPKTTELTSKNSDSTPAGEDVVKKYMDALDFKPES